jgi:hypothetical protein
MGGAILDWLFERAMPWIIITLIALVVVSIGAGIYALYLKSNSPSFTLYKSEWACTNMQRIPVTTYVKAGDVMIPMTTYHNECHQWNRQP